MIGKMCFLSAGKSTKGYAKKHWKESQKKRTEQKGKELRKQNKGT